MKLSIVTITCRSNPRIKEMATCLAGALFAAASKGVELEWIIVSDKEASAFAESLRTDVPMTIGVVPPRKSPHRNTIDPRPAHNSARNAGLLAATGDYIVFLDDCTLVTRAFFDLIADIAEKQLGVCLRTWALPDMVLPVNGLLSYRDHHDTLHEIGAKSVGGACWGAPRDKFVEIHGFDEAYDGEDKHHDLDAAIRLSRVGVTFVKSERANVVTLKRTKTKSEITTNREAIASARNIRLCNQLLHDDRRTVPSTEVEALEALAPVVARVAQPATSPAGPARPQRNSAQGQALKLQQYLDARARNHVVEADALWNQLGNNERKVAERTCGRHGPAPIARAADAPKPRPKIEDPRVAMQRNLTRYIELCELLGAKKLATGLDSEDGNAIAEADELYCKLGPNERKVAMRRVGPENMLMPLSEISSMPPVPLHKNGRATALPGVDDFDAGGDDDDLGGLMS